ncbi:MULTISPECIES: hypothetical protein [unclassified Streptomyces]|uniref:hypothetical protein n=1 Tax=unclassified Streptomyces TaxID=2593676 RepID=UPI000B2A5CCD|nr:MULTISPECIES: hypothetical protein [unclassified Streptomyces]MDX3772368.1 hypothetical protein [Streptomyces sp. AK08-01B]MDX3821866.1 hypothetical protein [Streptomyces sp. AK08-01A]
MSPHYEVQVLLHRIGRWWAVDIPRLGLQAQCRTLEHAEDLARGLVAEAVGAPPDVIVLDMMVPELEPVLSSVAKARHRRAAAVAAEDQAIAAAVQELVDKLRVSQGDAGCLLGMSPGEVARFTPPRSSATAIPGQQLTPVPAPSPARPGAAPPPRSRPGPARQTRQAISPARPSWASPEDGTEGRGRQGYISSG